MTAVHTDSTGPARLSSIRRQWNIIQRVASHVPHSTLKGQGCHAIDSSKNLYENMRFLIPCLLSLNVIDLPRLGGVGGWGEGTERETQTQTQTQTDRQTDRQTGSRRGPVEFFSLCILKERVRLQRQT